MRRFALCTVALLATALAACGGGGSDDDPVPAANDGQGALSQLASGASEVCAGREAVALGTAFSSAFDEAAAVDYDDVVEALERAAQAAPREIRADFATIVDAQVPFLQLIAQADSSNYVALAQDPAYRAAVAALGAEEFRTASKNVTAWFNAHCE